MFGRVRDARADDLSVLDDPTDIHDRRPVRRWGRILHHDGRVRRRLEIRERPFGGRVVGFHALQRVDEDAAALEIEGAVFLGDDAALDVAAGPEGVPHGAPGVLWVGAEEGFAVGADLEAGGGAGDCEVDDAGFVDGGFDGVGGGVRVRGDGAAVGVEGEFGLVEALVVEGVGAPEGRGGFAVLGRVEDFGVELAGCVDAAGGGSSGMNQP